MASHSWFPFLCGEMWRCSPVLFCHPEPVLSKSITQTKIETRAHSFNLSLSSFTQCSRQTLSLSLSLSLSAGWCGNSWVRLYKYSPPLDPLFLLFLPSLSTRCSAADGWISSCQRALLSVSKAWYGPYDARIHKSSNVFSGFLKEASSTHQGNIYLIKNTEQNCNIVKY